MDRSGGTGEVVDLVHFHKDGLTDVMEDEVEVLLVVREDRQQPPFQAGA